MDVFANLTCGYGQRAPFAGVETVVILFTMVSDVSICQYWRVVGHTRQLTARLQWFYSETEYLSKVADSYMQDS